ncbi:MAG: secondary thiamine-phosphate synthase enzyme YjbQ [Chloroflexi bacterium]|nr:secondary thiamine-phosphate synthase enzyme YjbQ [Chloroflexota bacterium]
MTVESRSLKLRTQGDCDIVDITGAVAREIECGGIGSGTVTIFVVGSTAGVSTIEHESGLLSDFKEMWDRIVPARIVYDHDQAWGDGNGHSHVRAAMLGPSLTVPFSNKKMLLGTWQQIVYVDFDNRPRSREVILQILGE